MQFISQLVANNEEFKLWAYYTFTEVDAILFLSYQGLVKRETRFTSKCSADEIVSKIEQTAVPLGFGVKKNNFKVKLWLKFRFLGT